MKVGSVFVISAVSVLITLHEWPKMDHNQKKEKWSFVTLTVAGWLLSIILVFYSDIPGPNNLIEKLFQPLGTLLEQ